MYTVTQLSNGNVKIVGGTVNQTLQQDCTCRADLQGKNYVEIVRNNRVILSVPAYRDFEIVANGETSSFDATGSTPEELATLLMETAFAEEKDIFPTQKNSFSTSASDTLSFDVVGQSYLVVGLKAINDTSIKLKNIRGTRSNNTLTSYIVCKNPTFDAEPDEVAINNDISELKGSTTILVSDENNDRFYTYSNKKSERYTETLDMIIDLVTGDTIAVIAIPRSVPSGNLCSLNFLQL